MTDPNLQMTKERVAKLEQRVVSPFREVASEDTALLISDWRTLSAALAEKDKEIERLLAEHKHKVNDLTKTSVSRLLQAGAQQSRAEKAEEAEKQIANLLRAATSEIVYQKTRAERAEAALASANEITEAELDRLFEAVDLQPTSDEHYDSARRGSAKAWFRERAALLAAQGKPEPENPAVASARKGGGR